MKKLLVLAIFLAGCSAQPTPSTTSTDAWQGYGFQQGELGQVKLSKTELQERSDASLTDALYLSYSSGYLAGVTEYCEQDPYMLGIHHKPYRGVCDTTKPQFDDLYRDGDSWDDDSGID
ncbi:DUF2799 domain-containing protein [Vibrio tritonius]|uniref:DUF2799 domain-containing protein n=1 Tax=Vibrio tritonius TaxID=1435069 RepID=A0ABS7YLY8_9VIBR|nr:DUF2799 domain-containing protein [Vibrio tritonius]MCA2016698.1 DUF2799 domain-containing protein [Vibrio tritonius]